MRVVGPAIAGSSFLTVPVNGGIMNLTRLSARDLEAQARSVELQIKKLDHRPRPTPSERMLSLELKKKRLTLKDQLASK
jgi:hypothetical protein